MKVEIQLNTKSKLLKAAITVFGKYGYAGSSMRQIAELAGVNHSSVKHHYQNKTQLWKATVSYLFGKLYDYVTKDEEAYASMGARETIVTMTRNYVLFAVKYPELARIRMFETIHESERLDWMTKHYLKPLTDRAIAGIEEGQRCGVYTNKIEAKYLHQINVAAMRAIFLSAPELERTMGVDVFSDEYLEGHLSALFKIMLVDEASDGEALQAPAEAQSTTSHSGASGDHEFGKKIL